MTTDMGRVDVADLSGAQLERALDVIFEETQQDRPPQSGPRWWRRWLRQGRQQHRATRFSQILVADLVAL